MQGASGPIGLPGMTGLQGPVGDDGEAGATGNAGPVGTPGEEGAVGEKGLAGHPGQPVCATLYTYSCCMSTVGSCDVNCWVM